MKKTKLYEEFIDKDECACGGNCQCGTTETSERNIWPYIDAAEDDEIEELMTNVEFSIDELITYIKTNAKDIGGSDTSTAIESKAAALVKTKLKKAKLIR